MNKWIAHKTVVLIFNLEDDEGYSEAQEEADKTPIEYWDDSNNATVEPLNH